MLVQNFKINKKNCLLRPTTATADETFSTTYLGTILNILSAIENADCNNGYDMLYCIYYTLMAYIFIFNDLLLGFFVNCWCIIFLHYVIILLWFYIKYYFMYYVICYVPIAHIIHKKEPFFTNAKPNKCSIHSTSVEKCHLLQLNSRTILWHYTATVFLSVIIPNITTCHFYAKCFQFLLSKGVVNETKNKNPC